MSEPDPCPVCDSPLVEGYYAWCQVCGWDEFEHEVAPRTGG